jgi:hypothetical protein
MGIERMGLAAARMQKEKKVMKIRLHKAHTRSSALSSRRTRTSLPGDCEGMPFTVRLARDLVVILIQPNPTVCAAKAMRMEFLSSIRLGILAFNASVALAAQTAVGFVVMLGAVRRVAVDIEFSGRKRRLAGFADEAFFMVTSG